jgi:hypothetical protein
MVKLSDRRAGGLELYWIYSTEMGYVPMVGASVKYSIPITKEVLYPALAKVIEAEPLLGVNVFMGEDNKRKNRYFRKIPSVNLDTVVKFFPGESVGSFTDTFYNIKTPYGDETLPLRRIFVLGEREVLFGFK